VRVRVDHQGFESISNQRFGARFTEQVANATDLLLFSRKKQQGLNQPKRKGASLKAPIAPDDLERTNMEDLVMQNLGDPAQKLKVLEDKKLNGALDAFVEKSELAAVADSTNKMLNQCIKHFIANDKANNDNDEGATVREMIESQVQEKEANEDRSKKSGSKGKNKDDEAMESPGKENSLEDDSPPPAKPKRTTKKATSSRSAAAAPKDSQRKVARRRQHMESDDDDDDDDGDDESVEVVQPVRKATKTKAASSRPSRSAAKRPKSYRVDEGDDDDEEEEEIIPIDLDDSEEEEPVKKKRSTKKTNTSFTSARSSKTTSGKRNRTRLADDSEDDDAHGQSMDQDQDGGLEDNWGTAETKSQASKSQF
jgi:hypothetical protein